jgi:tRNA A37 threonylcarbamoyladenosine synthetase subunit TsaC/SUA5/YrdC
VSTIFDYGQRGDRAAALAAAVRGGRLVVLPTDTCYGVGCDAFSGPAVRRLREAKQHSGPFLTAYSGILTVSASLS